MLLAQQTAKHLREVFFGGNWTCSHAREILADVTWTEATTRIDTLNTVAMLTFHMGYYVSAVLRVLQGEKLNAKDEWSFNHPPIQAQADWDALLEKMWDEVNQAAALLEKLPEEKFGEIFEEEKYGIYYRNIHGLIEHTHYHLGQIALMKKLLRSPNFLSAHAQQAG